MNTANAEHVTNLMNNWRLNSVGTDSVINKKPRISSQHASSTLK